MTLGNELGDMIIVLTVSVALIAYLCGCFNGAIIVSKYILRDDVRNHGSGNAGLTNFLRTFGGGLTAVVILTDVLKAVVALGSAVCCWNIFLPANRRSCLFWQSTGQPCSASWAICSPSCSASRAARASSQAAPSP